ncbi:hypothetical protein GB937_009141 [Aspergillus fischeri]|nr:hypothetical protein GB937_009141 [Aspergillus fischeri]
MVEYHIEVWASEPGPYVGGPIGTSEGDGVEAIKQAISKAGAIAKLVLNTPSPRIFPPRYFFRADTEGPLDEEYFRFSHSKGKVVNIVDDKSTYPSYGKLLDMSSSLGTSGALVKKDEADVAFC